MAKFFGVHMSEPRGAGSFRRDISALQIICHAVGSTSALAIRWETKARLLTSRPSIGLNKTAIKSAVVNVECVYRWLSVFDGNMSAGEHLEQLTSIKKCAWPVFTYTQSTRNE